MGFLESGSPMRWEDTPEYHAILDYVIEHGIVQFLEVYHKVKDRKNDVLLWGDELEFHVFKTMPDGKVKLSLRAHDLLAKLNAEDEELFKEKQIVPQATWHPEYGAWMIEATPYGPYGGFSEDLQHVETSLRYRRRRIVSALEPGEGLSSLVAWPLMGCGDFCVPEGLKPHGSVAESYFLPDELINPHPRFATLTRNIRLRRGKKVDIRLPLFMDKNTSLDPDTTSGKTFAVRSLDNLSETQTRPDQVYMDAMGFGMGCCCLQVTFQARDLRESRILYDQLAMLCPIFLALSAAAPIFKGMLVDTDVRWQVIAQSVDCRTPVNLGAADEPCILPGAKVPQRGTQCISKSRYDSIDCFISTEPSLRPEYNDGAMELNDKALKTLLENGIDEPLARHVAHLFVRDPLVVFSERISQVDDKLSTEHFENIQSTNWNTMRWKPPGLDVKTGWRVEFRPMEKQLTDFEDAAYITIIVLITRVILFFDLTLYVPISKVDENMRRAHERNAVLEQKFFFRKDLLVLSEQCDDEQNPGTQRPANTPVEEEYTEMTIAEILTGKGEEFPGLFPLISAYLEIMEADAETVELVNTYMDLLIARSRGELPTTATWMREFVQKHPDYKGDSVVSEKIASDLVHYCDKLSNGEIQDEALMGSNKIFHISTEDASRVNLQSKPTPQMLKNRLRGASFHEEIQGDSRLLYRCSLVRSLVDKYKNMPANKHNVARKGFADTPAFLSSAMAADSSTSE